MGKRVIEEPVVLADAGVPAEPVDSEVKVDAAGGGDGDAAVSMGMADVWPLPVAPAVGRAVSVAVTQLLGARYALYPDGKNSWMCAGGVRVDVRNLLAEFCAGAIDALPPGVQVPIAGETLWRVAAAAGAPGVDADGWAAATPEKRLGYELFAAGFPPLYRVCRASLPPAPAAALAA